MDEKVGTYVLYFERRQTLSLLQPQTTHASIEVGGLYDVKERLTYTINSPSLQPCRVVQATYATMTRNCDSTTTG